MATTTRKVSAPDVSNRAGVSLKPKLTLIQCGRGGSLGVVGDDVRVEVEYNTYHLPGTLVLEVGDTSNTFTLEDGITGAAWDAPFSDPVPCVATITTSGGSTAVRDTSD